MNPDHKIPITRPVFDGAEAEAVRRVLESGWVVQGPRVQEFEEAFAAFSGIPYAVASTSCTTALHLALIAAGLQKADRVIVPAFTFVASANAVEYLGARPVFCDVDLNTFNIDPASFEAAIEPGTRGVMPVHLFGLSCDMDPILAISRRAGLAIVEDAACAIGARYHGLHVGGFGNFGCLSFHPRKAITTGEGGMVVTRNSDAVARLRSLRDHGATKSNLARHEGGGFLLPQFEELGFNYRMTDIQAAVGVEQMKKLPALLEKRRAWAAHYDRILADIPWLRIPRTPPDCVHGYQSYVTRLVDPSTGRADTGNVGRLTRVREKIMQELEAAGISCRQGTHAVHMLSFYRRRYGLRPEQFPNAWIADHTTLSLPLYPQMEREDVERVADCLKEIGARAVDEHLTRSATSLPLEAASPSPTETPGVAVARRLRVLIAGASGFIGGAFLRQCSRDFACTALVHGENFAPAGDVEVRVQDLNRPLETEGLPEQVDAVLYLAQSGKYRNFPEDADEVVRVNVAGALALAQWARRAGCAQFIFASTAGFNSVYGERDSDDAPIIPDSFYTRTKQIGETLIQEYKAHFTVTILRPYTIYGAGQQSRLIPTILDQVASRRRVYLEGNDRGLLLSPLHLTDAVRTIRAILEQRTEGHVNLAGDETTSIREIAEQCGRMLGIPPVFEFLPEVPARSLLGSNRRMKSILKVDSLTPFQTGLEEIVRSRYVPSESTRR